MPEEINRLVTDAMGLVSGDLPPVFAVRPRARKKLDEFGLLEKLAGGAAQISLTEPLGYIQFMNLVRSARAVITDSGGVQEESTYLGIRCLTPRDNTERPITVSEGSNRLVEPEACRGLTRPRSPVCDGACRRCIKRWASPIC